jgi:tetratricopeptide (TPR) repeat protein
MGQGFAVDGTPGLLLLAVPILILAAVIIWAVVQLRQRPRDNAAPHSAAPEITKDVKQRSTKTAAAAPAEVASTPPAREETPPAAAALHEPPEAIDAAIAKSEKGGDKGELAHLYIRQAAAYLARDRKDEAAARLRDAIGLAALNGLVLPHALARVELGDLYLTNGDPITACEQWQIARNLFHDLARPTDRDAVDKRMLGNGCPTDWVLTDF